MRGLITMTNTALEIDFTTIRLTALENQALAHKDKAFYHWQEFARIVLEIKASKLWGTECTELEWNDYCKAKFGMGSSRIRQYKVAIPFAEILREATGKEFNEKQVRDLRAVVGDDTQFLLLVYQNAVELSGGIPKKRHFVAVYETLKNTANTGVSNVGGLSMPATPESQDAEMKEAIMEADIRFKQHRNPIKPLTVMAQRVGKLWALEGLNCELDSIELLYYQKG